MGIAIATLAIHQHMTHSHLGIYLQFSVLFMHFFGQLYELIVFILVLGIGITMHHRHVNLGI